MLKKIIKKCKIFNPNFPNTFMKSLFLFNNVTLIGKNDGKRSITRLVRIVKIYCSEIMATENSYKCLNYT